MNNQYNSKNMTVGPLILRNYRAFHSNASLTSAYEYPLFTDAYITGEISKEEKLGPYNIFNSLPNPINSNQLKPAIVLRIDYHLSNSNELKLSLERSKLNVKSNTKYFHAGRIEDEIAALLSVFLGIRVKSGNYSRFFDLDGDPKGKPQGPSTTRIPVLPPSIQQTPILPKAFGEHCLNSAKIFFDDFFKLEDIDAFEFIQSARYYQEAIWFSESFPSLSWLFFTSAIERAANHWNALKDTTGIEALKNAQPELVKELKKSFGIEAVQLVTKYIGDMFKLRSKFVEFLLDFCPGVPPEHERPPKYCRMKWNKGNLKSVFKKIYDHRSAALHLCIPFPDPMCESPNCITNITKNNYQEIPWAEGYGSYNSLWLKKDVPILLHAFEFIVRKSLLKWMETMARRK